MKKANLKRLERLGAKEAELLQTRKLYAASSVDMTELSRRNKVLRNLIEAKKHLPQQVPMTNLVKAFSKVHLVEDKINASVALAKDSAFRAVYTVFESLYQAMEPTCAHVAEGWTTGDEQVANAKALGLEVVRVLVDGCYQSILKQSGNLKQKGTLAKRFALCP